MNKKFKEILGKTDDVFREYPMVLLMAFLAAVSLICFAENDFDRYESSFVFIKFAMVSCLGISLMFALKMLSQRIGKSFLLEISGVLFLIFFYLLLPETEKKLTNQYAFLIIPTFILSHLLVSFVAFFGKEKELNFWQYNKNLFINIFLTVVFTQVLTGGVELAILAVDKLFDFNFDGKLYTETFFFFTVFGSSFIFLLFNEKGLKYLEKDGNYPVILKFFTQYILIPLLFIYAVILYFYSAKILINWELPRGWVSYLVLAYSVIGILALLLVHPLKEESAKSWVKVFSKIFYYTLIPLIVLLFTAIFTRILEYGYTEPRYFVLLLAIWLCSVVFYFIFSKKPTIKFVPISLFSFGLFALIFPYLNTFSVAKRSQKTELQKILVDNNLLEKGKIDFNKKVSDTVADGISDKFEFLAKRNEKEFLIEFLQKEDEKKFIGKIEKNDFWAIRSDIRNLFLKIEKTKNNYEWERLELVTENRFYLINDFHYFKKIPDFGGNIITIDEDTFKIINSNHKFSVILNNTEEWDTSISIQQILGKYKNKTGKIEVPEISTESDLGNYHLKIIFENLVRNHSEKDFYFGEAYLFIKKK